MFEQIVGRFGRLDVLVTTASIWQSIPLEDVTAEDVLRHFRVDALGTFLCARRAGLIMASQAGRRRHRHLRRLGGAAPLPGSRGLFLAKGSIPTLTRALAVELAHRNPRVRVNCIQPGPVLFPPEATETQRQAMIDSTLVKSANCPESVSLAVKFFIDNPSSPVSACPSTAAVRSTPPNPPLFLAPSELSRRLIIMLGNKNLPRLATLVVLLASFVTRLWSGLPSALADDSGSLKKVFAQPPRQYSTAPLWVWNDMLTDDQIRLTLRDLATQNVKQAFVHPRPGLMTPYLSDEWFRLWGVALDEAERLDMNVWIYDENSYPSGFAGGWVPRRMPESRGRGLRFQVVDQRRTWATTCLACTPSWARPRRT
jgi:hypothetical protein